MTPFVSVIVPIFNTERYVARCLQSLILSTLREIEIICVDDASTDASTEVVEEFVRKDERVRLIRHERNRGLGGARNTGIAAAKGNYVGAVDSDDWVAPTMYERLLEASDSGHADVVEGGFCQIDKSGQILKTYRPKARSIRNDRNQVNIFEVTRPSFCIKIWRRALFVDNSIWFPEQIFYEDVATTPRLLAMSTDIRFIEDSSYFYYKRDGSITFSSSDKHQMDHFKAFDILWDFLWEKDLVERYGEEFISQIGIRMAYHARNFSKSDVSEKTKAQYLRHMMMMTMGYETSYAELYDASCDDLVGMFKRNIALEKTKHLAQLTENNAALEAKVSKVNLSNAALEAEVNALKERIASLNVRLAAEQHKYHDLISDPFWKLITPARKVYLSGMRAARKWQRFIDG